MTFTAGLIAGAIGAAVPCLIVGAVIGALCTVGAWWMATAMEVHK